MSRWATAVAVAAALVAAGPPAVARPPVPPAGGADLRVVAAVPNAPGVAVSIDGAQVLASLPFATVTRPLPVAPGAHRIRVGGAAATVVARPGCTVDLVLAERPPGGAARLIPVTACERRRIPTGLARVTLLVASDEPGVVRLSDTHARAVEVAPFAVSAPLDLPAGRGAVTLTGAGSGLGYTRTDLDLAPGTSTLLVFLGGGDSGFRLVGTFDGAQPPAPPRAVEINTGRPGAASGREGPTPAAVTAAGAALFGALVVIRRGRHRPRLALTFLATMALAAGACAPGGGPTAVREREADLPAGAGGSQPASPTRPNGVDAAAVITRPPMSVPPPVRVRIPALGVDAAVLPLPTPVAPTLPRVLGLADVGWFAGSSTPGTIGTAVLAGHTGQRAVFGRLASVPAGAAVVVTDAAGHDRSFTVRSRAAYPKGRLPDALWSPVRTPSLLLVSCAGPLRADGLHRDNLVVWAEARTPER